MSGGAQPAKKLAIVTCMDARVDPLPALGLEVGDAHVIRNAGGVSPTTRFARWRSRRTCSVRRRSWSSTTPTAGCSSSPTRTSRRLEEDFGHRPEWDPGAFDDLEGNLRESICRIQASPFIPRKDSIRGFVYEVETGNLREIS